MNVDGTQPTTNFVSRNVDQKQNVPILLIKEIKNNINVTISGKIVETEEDETMVMEIEEEEEGFGVIPKLDVRFAKSLVMHL